MRLVVRLLRLAEKMTSCPSTLSALETVPLSFQVPPLGRKTEALPPSTRPTAVERVSAPGAAMPATLPSAVSSRLTDSPRVKFWAESQALSSTSSSLPRKVMVLGVFTLGSAFWYTQVMRRSETMRVLLISS